MTTHRRSLPDPRPVHLAGVSGTPASRHAVRQAALAASRAGAVLHLVHAFAPRRRHTHAVAHRDTPADVAHGSCPCGDAEALLAAEAEAIADIPLAVVLHAIPGDTAEALIRGATRTRAQVVTLGSERITPKRFGVAARVTRSVPCEVRVLSPVAQGQLIGYASTSRIAVSPASRAAR
jgi:hypothetical protein